MLCKQMLHYTTIGHRHTNLHTLKLLQQVITQYQFLQLHTLVKSLQKEHHMINTNITAPPTSVLCRRLLANDAHLKLCSLLILFS